MAELLELLASDQRLYGKFLDLQHNITGWLSYIPATFPAYTKHTHEHSDAIIAQLSLLLFDGDTPVISLTEMDAYILCCAAYLHDAGMVVSDSEKASILRSEEWEAWVSEGPIAQHWADICTQREGADGDPAAKFTADLQLRRLLADFVRRRHHLRVKPFLKANDRLLSQFSFDDPALALTIAEICAAHGLRRHELQDNERFPLRRDLLNSRVNVRLLAILLRLGDLLDMSTDRACPLLLNAASPIPADSVAHWSQYQRIKHRVTSPTRIELVAECQTQDEHRILRDWCQWLEEEVMYAPTLLAESVLHREWEAPVASLGGPTPSIVIRPAPGALYFPADWTLELDTEEIISRLVNDVHAEDFTYVRELLQNAIDATRRVMYDELDSAEKGTVDSLHLAPRHIREARPVVVEVEDEVQASPESGLSDSVQKITVTDHGPGMSEDDIRRYLLQVGRSYYRTSEFRRRYPFTASSRFGIGFLSVFAVSDHVEVVTKVAQASESGATRVVLTGPRNYLLTERCDRKEVGTSVAVTVRDRLDEEALIEAIQRWCSHVEIPIIVRAGGRDVRIFREDDVETDNCVVSPDGKYEL